ncbi:MAG: hypothetical protein PHV52_00065 [Aliarcobacter sp.]|nr:hypothetical protein [Aliarcobacter sp.]
MIKFIYSLFKKKTICDKEGHIYNKENTQIDLDENSLIRLSEFETDYKNKCTRCNYVLRWTHTPFGNWKNKDK